MTAEELKQMPFNDLKEMARTNNNPDALYELAQRYLHGNAPKNENASYLQDPNHNRKMAKEYLQRAATHGHPTAAAELAKLEICDNNPDDAPYDNPAGTPRSTHPSLPVFSMWKRFIRKCKMRIGGIKPKKSNDKIWFGKHKGMTIIEIVTSDCQYLVWAEKNIRRFMVDWDDVRLKLKNSETAEKTPRTQTVTKAVAEVRTDTEAITSEAEDFEENWLTRYNEYMESMGDYELEEVLRFADRLYIYGEETDGILLACKVAEEYCRQEFYARIDEIGVPDNPFFASDTDQLWDKRIMQRGGPQSASEYMVIESCRWSHFDFSRLTFEDYKQMMIDDKSLWAFEKAMELCCNEEYYDLLIEAIECEIVHSYDSGISEMLENKDAQIAAIKRYLQDGYETLITDHLFNEVYELNDDSVNYLLSHIDYGAVYLLLVRGNDSNVKPLSILSKVATIAEHYGETVNLGNEPEGGFEHKWQQFAYELKLDTYDATSLIRDLLYNYDSPIEFYMDEFPYIFTHEDLLILQQCIPIIAAKDEDCTELPNILEKIKLEVESRTF